MNILLFLCLFFGINSHDIQVAFYKIEDKNENLHIEFVLEKDDIQSTFTEIKSELSDENLQKYLSENFFLFINNEKQYLSFSKMQVKNKHIYLQGSLPKLEHAITSLAIKNTCLLNIEGHSNIIQIRLHDEERDFLMNTDRTSITINY